jgi:hypothetical protein
VRVLLTKKFNSTLWRKQLWIRGFIWSLPNIRTGTPLLMASKPGNLINKLLDRGVLAGSIRLVESSALKLNLLRHSVISLQKILSIALLWGLIAGLYYLRN